MSTFLSAFGGNARTSQEDKLKQLLQRFTTKFALSTQYPHCHQDKLRKQLKQPLQQVTTLRQIIAPLRGSSKPRVACSETTFTTLRLAHEQVELSNTP